MFSGVLGGFMMSDANGGTPQSPPPSYHSVALPYSRVIKHIII